MCGRFFISRKIEEKARGLLSETYDQQLLSRWNPGDMFPGNLCLAIDSLNQPALMNWGYELFSRKIINTRLESIIDKDYYRPAFRNGRCLIIASGFYEWDESRKIHLIRTADETIYLAAICQPSDPVSNFSIITKPATQSAHIHPRVPLVLNRQQASQYLMTPDTDQLMNISPLLIIE